LLVTIAKRLQLAVRAEDTVARMGGDEFVVLLPHCDRTMAERVANTLLDKLRETIVLDGSVQYVAMASIGVALFPDDGATQELLLRNADIAMYEAKRTGRARYVMFEPSMRQEVSASVSLENDLRQALDKCELFVVYQPLINLADGEFSGVEALLRWRHPQRGMVSPVEFIPIAEACGLIDALGQFVLQTACRAFAAMPFGSPENAITLAVNLSRAQLLQAGLTADVQDALRANGLSPQQLVLEVTESLAAQDELVLSTLHALRVLGVALSLDDFGTGYSSLSCLHELPVNYVKVDRSFVSQAQNSAYHRVMIEATIRMAQTLGLATVAEGIETVGQAALMATLGCDKGQGYLYSKPLEAHALVAWVQERLAKTSFAENKT
jgi:predicted signal transduction protein with EAL and GGDEF domain